MGQNVIQAMMDLSDRVDAAKAEAKRLDAEVKRMHNEIYGPLCIAKKLAHEDVEDLVKQLSTLIAENKTLFDAIKKIG